MPGSRLTRRDRRAIATGLADGLGYAEIARRLARPTSTVSREVTRNGGRASYDPGTAHRATKQRLRQPRPGQEAATNPHPRPETVRAVERQLAATLAGTGLPAMSARVLAALLTKEDAGMTAAELSQHLRVSSSSVSKSVRYLSGEGVIRRERITQRRVERYLADPDAWFRAFLASAQRNHQLADTARQGSDLIGRTTPVGARLHALSRFHQQLTNDIIERARHWRHALTEPPPPVPKEL
jgi:DNA-binding transcriptional regulator GbsR (MarR family)